MAQNTIEVGLDLDTKEAEQDLKGFSGDAKKAGNKAGDNFSKGFGTSLKKIGKIAAGATALIGSIGAALTFKESIAAAQVQEDAINKLNSSLQISGKFTEDASRSFQQFASQLQSVTRFGDETLLQVGALINSLTDLDQKGLQRATSATADLATALRIDINSAANLVSKALAGQTSALTRYGISVEKGATEAETLENVLGALEKKFGGAAQKDVGTFSGAVEQLSNTFGDLLEEIGFVITQNPKVVATFGLITKGLQNAIKSVGDFSKDFNIFDEVIPRLFSFNDAVINFVIAPLELVSNIFRLAVNVINNGAATIVAAFGVIAEGYAELISLVAGENGLTKSLRTFADTSAETLNETSDAVAESFNKALDFPVSDKLAMKNEELKASLEAINTTAKESTAALGEELNRTVASTTEAQSGLLDVFGVSITAAAEKTGDALKAQQKQTASIIKGGIAKSISGGIQNIAQSIAKGEDVFANFGKFLLSTFGDLAIQLGSFFIAEGIAVEALQAVSGTGAIAAGAALVALGSILKSFAGSGGGGGAAGATTGGIGAGGGVTPETVTTAETAPDDIERRTPQTSVNVNIEGSIFDGDDTPRRIAELISEGGAKEGIIINDVRSFA
jgi:hypothetical protein